MRIRFLYILLVALGAYSAPAAADPVPIATVPDSTFKEVFIGLVVIEVTDINVREETFDVEGLLVLMWEDQRYAHEVGRSYIGNAALDRLEREIWWPYPEFQNARGERERRGIELYMHEPGEFVYEERFSARLSFKPNLRRFPFDRQELRISIFPALSDATLAVFSEHSDSMLSPEFSLEEWDITDITPLVSTGPVYGLEDWMPFSRADFTMAIERRPGFYIWKVFVPLMLIVGISWCVFWFDPRTVNLGQRGGFSVTAVLTIVAYNFVVTDFLPRISYLTFLDAVITLAYIVVALSIVVSVTVHYFMSVDRYPAARKVDFVARIAFPSAFFGTMGVLALAYLL